MMANLFSSFDPSTSTFFSLNWLSIILMLTLLSPLFWMIPSRFQILLKIISLSLYSEFKILANSKKMKGSMLMFISLFFFILMNNFMGLFPYIFTSTSHLNFTLTLALPLWLSFMLYGWMNNTIHMLAHLIPQGTPTPLVPFMICIETISNVIRPGTLAIRLTANMIAGHLLLTLLGNMGSVIQMWMLNFLIITQILLMILETAVSMIQSYVFTVLSILYSSEVN
uniref:ATP synthase subunit a n=1 Tax=Aspidiphorus orbiculatus TaxID=577441 RepID=A0A0S2M6I6_9CUCU|nr:ATP synthase F0 subunit 6 [Aspidiphorus orbiculatus]